MFQAHDYATRDYIRLEPEQSNQEEYFCAKHKIGPKLKNLLSQQTSNRSDDLTKIHRLSKINLRGPIRLNSIRVVQDLPGPGD